MAENTKIEWTDATGGTPAYSNGGIMTTPTAQEMAEKLVRDYDLARLLPCLCVYEDGQHEDDCPADYRPAIAQALSAKDAEIVRLTAERDDHMAANLEFDTKLTAAKAEIDRLREALGFFMSAVKSGESWSGTCEQMRRAALGETP